MRLRPTARVALLDGRDRILLFRLEDPTIVNLDAPEAGPFWILPGVGVGDGEDHAEAARRELWEETGIAVDRLGPCVWTSDARLANNGEPVLCASRVYLARVSLADVRPYHLPDLELEAYRGHRWWSAAEIRASSDGFVPRDLGDLLEPIVAGEVPESPIAVR